MKNNLSDSIGNKQMHIVRIFQAPRELVFSLWTNPEYLQRWWGPNGFSSLVDEINVKPGGRIRITMQGPNGQRLLLEGGFQEVDPPSKLVFSTSKIDEHGKPELEALHTILLTEENGGTKLSMEVLITNLTEASLNLCQEMESGWEQSFDKMSQFINEIKLVK